MTSFKQISVAGPRKGVLAFCAASVGLAALMAGAPAALAQDGQQGEVSTGSALMGDIVVTARKREEGVQDVPIAISAFSSEAIEARGVTQVDQLAAFTPNLTYQNNPGFGGASNVAAIYIRGIGQFDFLGSIEPGVGLYIDGVYIARSVGSILDLVDIERVEILRGPQGTLFGRNTIGGAVSITSQEPADEFGGKVSALYGTDNRFEIKGSVDIPVGDTFGIKLSGAYMRQDGFITDLNDPDKLGNKDTFVGRIQTRWEPTDDLTVRASFDYTKDKSNGVAAVLIATNTNSNVFNPNRLPLLPPGPPISPFTLVGGGTAAGGGFQGLLNTAAAPPGSFPPVFDYATQLFYQLNVAAARPPFGSPAGTPADPAFAGPLDAPVDNFTLLHNYLVSYGPGGTPGLCVSAPFQPYYSETANPACFGAHWAEAALGKNTVATNRPNYSDSEIWGGALNIDYNFGPAELVSITSYREISSSFARDQDLTPFDIAFTLDEFDQWQFSQELQLKGTAIDDRLSWIVGGFYSKEEVDNLNDVIFAPASVRSGGQIENKSIAAFGQATFSVTEQLALTGGLRWTKDDKTFDSGPYQFVLQSNVGPGIAYGFDSCPGAETAQDCPAGADTDGVPATGPFSIFGNRVSELTIKKLTPYVNLSYDWTDDVMTYVSYSEGFKSGGFTQRVFPPLASIPTVGEEEVKVYEAGFKASLLDRMLRLNGSVFYTDYTNLQIQGFTPETGVAPVYFNAGAASIKGFELDFAATPFEGLFIEGAIGYLDAGYDELSDAVQAATGILITNKFERVPEVTASLAAQYEYDLGPAYGSLSPRVDWSYRSKQYFNARNTEEVAQDGYSVFNGTVTYRTPEENYSIIFGVNNIFDKRYFVSAIVNDAFAAQTGTPDRGRQWYIRGTASF